MSTIPPPSPETEILHDFPPFFKVYKDGHFERYANPNPSNLPPGLDPKSGIVVKDIVIHPDSKVVVRVFTPKLENPDEKLPLIFHVHGGGFCGGSALDPPTHNFVLSLLKRVDAIFISVEYRLAPEHPLPIAYYDSWDALKFVAMHFNGSGSIPEPGSDLNLPVDLNRVFLMGESAGANIVHNLAIRAGVEGLKGLTIMGLLVIHPFFVGDKVDEMYKFICPTSSGCKDDPRLYSGVDPNLTLLGTGRVLVCVAEKDYLKERGVEYYENLKKSEWVGSVELFESKGGEHCCHMFGPNDKLGKSLLRNWLILSSLIEFLKCFNSSF